MKKCGCCQEIKPLESFHLNKNTKTGRNCYCIVCFKEKSKKLYSSEKEINRKRISRYGINTLEYDMLYLKQLGNCKICDRHFKSLCIDHDHKTGRVRGLLCKSCNGLLGRAGEKPHVLVSAAKYLITSKAS